MNSVNRRLYQSFVFTIGVLAITISSDVWADCSGNTTIASSQGQVNNSSWLCSFTVNSGVTLSNNLGDGRGLINQNGTIDVLTNNGTLTGNNDGLYNRHGTITSMINNGTISPRVGGGAATAITNMISSTLTSLTNGSTGNISGPIGVYNDSTSQITTITNSGSITGTSTNAISNANLITNLINNASGVISGSVGVNNNTGATITTITNYGTITGSGGPFNGISNSGTITTLNNKQGDNGSSPLTYSGALPTNYKIIISGTTTFGQLAAGVVTGSTVFGISSLSTTSSSILNTPLLSVFTGITPANLGLGSATTTSGISNGYSYTLTETTPTSKIWNLTVTACSVCDSGGGSSGGSGGSSNDLPLSIPSNDVPPSIPSKDVPPSIPSNDVPPSIPSKIISTGFSTNSNALTPGSTLDGGTVTFDPFSGAVTNITITKAGATLSANSASPFKGAVLPVSIIGSFTVNGTLTIKVAPDTLVIVLAQFSGPGNVVIEGANATSNLIWAGESSLNGGTTILSANVQLINRENLSIGSGPIYVGADAQLSGIGTFKNQIVLGNGGILKPGNSPGYLATSSNVIFNSGSRYKQDIAGTNQASSSSPVGATGYYSYLSIGGQLLINPGTTLSPQLQNLFQKSESGYGSAPYVPNLGDTFRITTATGGITGRFTTLIQPDGLAPGTQFASFYNMNNSNSIDLAVIPSSYPTTVASASGNKNAQSVGAALDKIAQANVTGTSTNNQDALLYAISGQNSAAGIASYAQSLAGELYAATVAVIAQTTQRVQQAVLTRLGDTMGIALPSAMTAAGNTALMNSTNTALSGGVASSAVSTNPAVNPESEYKSWTNGNVWGDLAYQKGNRSSDSNSGGWNTNLYQLVFGSDFYVSNGMRLGGGIALSNTTLNPNYGSGTIQQGSIFAYGKIPIEEYVVDAMASFGLNNSDLSRSDITNLSGGFRNKSISGNDAMVSLGLSRPIDTESIRITPYARVTWQMVNQSGVNEGDTASALSVNSYTGNGVRGVLGVAIGSKTNNPMTEQYTYRAYVGVGADTSGLLNPTLNASIVGMGTTITTPNAGSTFVQAGLYGTAKVSDNAYAFAGLSGEARSGQTLGAVNVGLRIQF